MTVCYYCNRPVGDPTWYHKDVRLGYSVKICQDCHLKFDAIRSQKNVQNLKKSIEKAYDMCMGEYGMSEDDGVRCRLKFVLNHLDASLKCLSD